MITIKEAVVYLYNFTSMQRIIMKLDNKYDSSSIMSLDAIDTLIKYYYDKEKGNSN